MRRWKTVPFGMKKIVHTTPTWHPNVEPNKTRARREIKNDIKKQLDEYLMSECNYCHMRAA